MNDTLKQRLIGALILLALGVVFWPIIFVEPGAELSSVRHKMPLAPAIDTSQLPVPSVGELRPSQPLSPAQDPVALDGDKTLAAQATDVEVAVTKPGPEESIDPAPPIEDSLLPVQPQTRTEAPIKPEIDADGVPIAWILRVASVSNDAKAEELRLRLLGMEQKAYVKKIKRGDEALYRVYIGPKFEKSKLEAIQSQVNREFGVQTMITRYIP